MEALCWARDALQPPGDAGDQELVSTLGLAPEAGAPPPKTAVGANWTGTRYHDSLLWERAKKPVWQDHCPPSSPTPSYPRANLLRPLGHALLPFALHLFSGPGDNWFPILWFFVKKKKKKKEPWLVNLMDKELESGGQVGALGSSRDSICWPWTLEISTVGRVPLSPISGIWS